MDNFLTGLAIVVGMSIPAIFSQSWWERWYERRDKKRKAQILERLLRSKQTPD